MILKISGSTEFLTRPRKGGVGVGGDSRVGCDGSGLDGSEIDGGEVDGNEVGDDKGRKKVQKMSKSKNLFKSKKLSKFKETVGSSDFLSPELS